MSESIDLFTNSIEDSASEVIDTSLQEDEGISNSKYLINSYGADYTIDSLVQRINRNDIYIPSFQRSYVWTLNQASKFVESLLLGLPVPGIFLSKDEDRRLVVIDGQQRLRTLQRFYKGVFDEKNFALRNVRDNLTGKTYDNLNDEDRRQLDDSILHATIIQQIAPQDNDSSIYHIFERLNTGGTKLQPQEIRASIYYGAFITLLGDLNDYEPWRNIYGNKNKRGKDQELILRFLALNFMGNKYQKPLNEFLNKFTLMHRDLATPEASEFSQTFKATISTFHQAVGRSAFRSQRVLNAAVFDSVMVGLAKRLAQGSVESMQDVKSAHDELIRNEEFIALYTSSTTDEKNVANRIALSTSAFEHIR